MGDFNIQYWGLIPYAEAITRMEKLHSLRVADRIRDTLLCLEHPTVITRGRRLHSQPLSPSPEIARLGIPIIDCDRGGLLTLHAPGQIVVYLIIKLRQPLTAVADIVFAIQRTLQDFISNFGIEATVKNDLPGLWADGKKFASIGLRISQGVTKHGISINVCNDLSIYQHIEPCGLAGSVMTSLSQLTGRKIAGTRLKVISLELCRYFARELFSGLKPVVFNKF